MTDRPKRPRDANQLAKFIVDLATEGESSVPLPDHEAQRKGGLKGGYGLLGRESQDVVGA